MWRPLKGHWINSFLITNTSFSHKISSIVCKHKVIHHYRDSEGEGFYKMFVVTLGVVRLASYLAGCLGRYLQLIKGFLRFEVSPLFPYLYDAHDGDAYFPRTITCDNYYTFFLYQPEEKVRF